jgi:hypothetical protein
MLAFFEEAACCNSEKDSYGNPGISDTDGPSCVLCLIRPNIPCIPRTDGRSVKAPQKNMVQDIAGLR